MARKKPPTGPDGQPVFHKKAKGKKKGKSKKKAAPTVDLTGLDLAAYGKRWQESGESIAALATEINRKGLSWNRLWSELDKLGFSKGEAKKPEKK